MGKQPQIVEIKMAAVEAMVERAKGLLAKEDHDLLKGLVDTLLTLVGLVRKGRTTIARLRRLVGMVSTEKTTEVLGKLSEGEASAADGTADPAEHNEEKPAAENNAAAGKQSSTTETAASPKPDTGAQAATKPKGHGRLPASDYPDATHITVAHESLSPGDICPACGRGKLYALKEPARFLRIVGQAPLVAVCWDCQRLRCSACGLPHTARAPDEAQGDKHSETAAAMMVLLRYDAGVPLNRLEQLQHALKTPVPSSTQWGCRQHSRQRGGTGLSRADPVGRAELHRAQRRYLRAGPRVHGQAPRQAA